MYGVFDFTLHLYKCVCVCTLGFGASIGLKGTLHPDRYPYYWATVHWSQYTSPRFRSRGRMFAEGPVICSKFAHISFTAACAALVKVASLSLAPAQRFEGKTNEKLQPAREVACRYHFYRPLQCSARAGACFLQVTSPVPSLSTSVSLQPVQLW